MGLKQFFNSLSSTPTLLPRLIRIPNENTDDAEGLAGEFEPAQHYFTVRVNEMYLSKERKWFRDIEPMVVCLTTYLYGEKEIENPFIVGKNLIKAKMPDVDEGMVFLDTRVAGIHQFAGGRLVVSIALCQSVTKDYLADSLDFISKISSVLNKNLTAFLGNYLEIANVVIGGIDKLFDSKAVEPLFGFRKEFDRDVNDHFTPGYYVMVKSDTELHADKFKIKENRLFYVEDNIEKEFRDAEYVLFSITKSDRRTDFTLLPFYQSYQKILDEMKVPKISDDLKTKIKSMLRILSIEMRQSPDLTEPQALILIAKYTKEVGELIDPKYNWSAEREVKKDAWNTIDEKILAL